MSHLISGVCDDKGLRLGITRISAKEQFVARHYSIEAHEENVEALAAGERRLPERSAVLTFDDGYANNLSLAAPILEKLGLPATVFLATDYVGQGGLFWWDELAVLLAGGRVRVATPPGWGRLDLTRTTGVGAALAHGRRLLAAASLDERRRLLENLRGAIGGTTAPAWTERLRPATWEECRGAPSNIRFGGHGASHRLLHEIPPDQAEADVRQCSVTLRAELGCRATPVFCYPAGYSTPAVRAAVAAAGFRGAVSADAAPSPEGLATPTRDRYLLPRLGVSAHLQPSAFAAKLAGLRELLNWFVPSPVGERGAKRRERAGIEGRAA